MPGADSGAALQREILSRAAVGVFLLLPFLAGVLTLLYVRRNRYYVEHFVFALHLQTFAFLILTARALLDPVPFLPLLLLLWLPVYTVLAMKEVYAQSWPKTVGKFIVLSGVYALGLGMTLLALVFMALLLMPV
jgi:hypothetical protein